MNAFSMFKTNWTSKPQMTEVGKIAQKNNWNRITGSNMVLYTFLFLVSCSNIPKSEPVFDPPEYRISKESFLKIIPIADSLSISVEYRSFSSLGIESSNNVLKILLFKNEKVDSKQVEDFHSFNIEIQKIAYQEITNINIYDKLELIWMQNGVEVNKSMRAIEK